MSSPLQENDIFSLDRIDLVAQTIRDTALGSPLIEFGFMSDVHVSLEAGMKTAAFYSEDFFFGS